MPHLIDKIDVVMLTKNSLNPCLSLSIDSILREIPINKLIIVDGGSNDGTIDLLNKYKHQNSDLDMLILFDKNGNRATSRQLGVSKVSTSIFAFVDSDVVLTRGWFNKIIKHLDDPKVGAVWGAALPVEPRSRKYYEAMAKLYRTHPLELAREQGSKRGLLHDTLIRKDAIQGIIIPKELQVMEDHFIRKYIEKRGYKWITTSEPYCLHYVGKRKMNEIYFDAYYGWKLGVYEKHWYAKHTLLFWAKLIYLLCATHDLKVVSYEFAKEKQFLVATINLLFGR